VKLATVLWIAAAFALAAALCAAQAWNFAR
jgi:hypothetical protein